MREGKNGGLLRSGNPANRGGARQRESFLNECRKLAIAAPTIRALSKVLQNPSHRHWPAAAKLVFEHGFGRPQQFIDLTQHETPDVAAAMALIESRLAAMEERRKLAAATIAATAGLREQMGDGFDEKTT